MVVQLDPLSLRQPTMLLRQLRPPLAVLGRLGTRLQLPGSGAAAPTGPLNKCPTCLAAVPARRFAAPIVPMLLLKWGTKLGSLGLKAVKPVRQ